ncbi:MAG: tetratricopeptide repeat protein, partial [Abditibacteriales bacterium]|nr:tetratricopeptide repeat protein [Abditibacteriales bacterium]MDW8367693.1 tetratricopeptide repeat protein [Abditibacteriales bacterium]
MRLRFALWTGLGLLVNVTLALAQTPSDFLARLQARGQQLKSLEATMTTQAFTAGGLLTTQEEITFVAPSQLRIQTTGGDVPEVDWQVTVCSDKGSYVFTPATRRLRRWRENLVDQWVRGTGGPANVANFGTKFDRVAETYTVAGSAGQPLRGRPTYQLVLTEKNPTRFFVNDFVRTGGGSGYPIYFNVFKRSVTAQPPRVHLLFDAERAVLLRREHFDDRQRLIEAAEVTETKEIAPGLFFPVAFEVKDRAGQLISRVSYEVQRWNVEALKRSNAFVLPPMPDVVAEDAVLQPIAEYRRGADDADTHYNLALALWRQAQDMNAAIAALQKVVALKPQAVVPRLTAADILMVGRRYQEALSVYEEAFKVAPDYPGLRAAKGFLAQRTYQRAAAIAEFEAAVKEQPHNIAWLVLLGELYQQQGEDDRAQRLYESALRAPAPTHAAAQLAAIDNLRLLTIWRDRADALLQATANDPSPFMQTLRGDLFLHQKKLDDARAAYERARAAAPHNFSLAFRIAVALEQAGDTATAQRQYEALAQLGTQSVIGVNALRALIGLHASAGRHEEAWKIYLTLHDALDSEADKVQERRRLLETYRKRFRLDDLMAFLKTKLPERPPREEVFRMLTELLDYYGQKDEARVLTVQATATFPASPYWRIRQSDVLVAEAVTLPNQTAADKDRRFRQARRLAEEAVRLDPQQFYYRAQLAYIVNRGQFFMLDRTSRDQWKRESLQMARDLMTAFPNDPDALTVYATIELDQIRSAATATSRFQQALEMGKPLHVRFDEVFFIRQMLAQVALARKDLASAVQQYGMLFDAAPDLTREAGTGAMFLTLLTQVVPESQSVALDNIIKLFLIVLREPNTKADKDQLLHTFIEGIAPQGKPDGTTVNTEMRQKVADAITQKLKEANADPYLHHVLGRLYAAEGKADAALAAYERAANAVPHDPDLASWTGDGYLQQARQEKDESKRSELYRTALRWYRQALTLDPSRIEDYYWTAVAHWGLKEINKPAEIAREMMRHVPNDFRALTTLARLYLDVGRFSQAVDAARDALARGVTDPAVSSDEIISLSFGLAGALAQDGKFTEAET